MRFAPRRREWIIGSAWRALKQTKPQRSFNAISYPDEPGLREPDSLHFFRIFKEQPNQTYCAARAARWALSFPVTGSWWVWVDLNHRPHAYQACALTS